MTDGGCGVTRDSQTEEQSQRRTNGEDRGARAARSAAAWVRQDDRREHRRREWCSRLPSCRAHTVPTCGRHPSPRCSSSSRCLLRVVSVRSVPPFVNLLRFLRPLHLASRRLSQNRRDHRADQPEVGQQPQRSVVAARARPGAFRAKPGTAPPRLRSTRCPSRSRPPDRTCRP
jgi:hypothetical protein